MNMRSVIIIIGIFTTSLAHGQAFQLTPSSPSAPYQYQPYSQYLTPNGPISSNPNAASAIPSSDFVGPTEQQVNDPFANNGQTERCGPQSNGDYILCEGVGNLISQRQTNFAAFLRELYILAFILAGTVAFVRIVYGGVLYSMSGVVDRKKQATGIFQSVAWGMALLMGSYIILNTINPALTILSLPKIQQGGGPAALPTKQAIGTFTPEERATMERATREWGADADLMQSQIDELAAKENKTTEDTARLKDLQTQLDKTQSALKGVEYQLGTEGRLQQLNKGMTTDQLMKAMQTKP